MPIRLQSKLILVSACISVLVIALLLFYIVERYHAQNAPAVEDPSIAAIRQVMTQEEEAVNGWPARTLNNIHYKEDPEQAAAQEIDKMIITLNNINLTNARPISEIHSCFIAMRGKPDAETRRDTRAWPEQQWECTNSQLRERTHPIIWQRIARALRTKGSH